MNKPVNLTPQSRIDISEITEFLTKSWGKKSAELFINKFEKFCLNISAEPGLFPFFHKRKRIRKCAITKQNIVLYRQSQFTIDVITIFNTRQNPKRLKTFI